MATTSPVPSTAGHHSSHTGHGDMNMGGGGGGDEAMQCSMAMVWNASTQGMCIVFSSWHVRGRTSLICSLVALFVLGAVLEYLRYRIRLLDAQFVAAYRLGGGSLLGRDGTHRRKASVQQVLGIGHPAKISGIGGPTLAASLGAAGSGRSSPSSYFPPDSASSRSSSNDDDGVSLLPGGGFRPRKPQSLAQKLCDTYVPSLPISRRHQLRRAVLYVAALSLSMFLMLVFMTYNAWLIAAVLLGAGAGHYLFHRDIGMSLLSDDKAAGACH